MKVCTKCKKELPLDRFGIRKDRGSKPNSWCKTCCKGNLESVLKARRKKQDEVTEIKRSGGCVVCGLSEPVALDFHHTDPSIKDSDIAQMFANHTSMNKILTEIEKCVIICANHHRMLHAGLITLE